MDNRCDLTPRGRAWLLAIQAGLVVPVEGQFAPEAFNAFWNRVEAEVLPGLAAGIGWGRRDEKWQLSGSLPARTARA